jgi:hypothetical protein
MVACFSDKYSLFWNHRDYLCRLGNSGIWRREFWYSCHLIWGRLCFSDGHSAIIRWHTPNYPMIHTQLSDDIHPICFHIETAFYIKNLQFGPKSTSGLQQSTLAIGGGVEWGIPEPPFTWGASCSVLCQSKKASDWNSLEITCLVEREQLFDGKYCLRLQWKTDSTPPSPSLHVTASQNTSL